jgi:hypothetical protein
MQPLLTVVENVVTGGLFGRRPPPSGRSREAAELHCWVGLEGKRLPRNSPWRTEKIEIAPRLP